LQFVNIAISNAQVNRDGLQQQEQRQQQRQQQNEYIRNTKAAKCQAASNMQQANMYGKK
jgi:hypothetical protein